MNELQEYFFSNPGRPIHKLSHYFEIYERYFSRYRNKKPVVLEIGVDFGGSLEMWRQYFGDGARIIGVDINEKCLAMRDKGFEIFIGSQGDPAFWDKVKAEVPTIDILIDDGSHNVADQRATFDCMYDHVAEDGIFLVEDCHTNYRHRYGGRHRASRTFIELSKDCIDELTAYYAQQETLPFTRLTRTCDAIHFYEAVVVFEKRRREMPYNVFSGDHPLRGRNVRKPTNPDELPPISSLPPAGASRRPEKPLPPKKQRQTSEPQPPSEQTAE